jgi:hypothetical protein
MRIECVRPRATVPERLHSGMPEVIVGLQYLFTAGRLIRNCSSEITQKGLLTLTHDLTQRKRLTHEYLNLNTHL